jgi:hypothetical protein
MRKNAFECLIDSDSDDTQSDSEHIKDNNDTQSDSEHIKDNNDTQSDSEHIKDNNDAPPVSQNVKNKTYIQPFERNYTRENNQYITPSNNNDDNTWGHNIRRRNNINGKKYKDSKIIEQGVELKYYDDNIELKGNNLKLNSIWTVWVHENTNIKWDIKSYKSIYEIDNIGSMLRFLAVFHNLDKNVRQYYIMRDGITPIWEDNNNKTGGICSIMFENMNRRVRNNSNEDIGVDIFIAICILVLNESFVKNNLDINGLCYSIKNRCVLIKLWIKDFDLNTEFIELLPISLLKKIDSVISTRQNESHIFRNNGKSRVSVQIKRIQPED